VGAGYDTAVVYNDLIEPLWLGEGPVAALETCHQAIEFTERRRGRRQPHASRSNRRG
jgi:hypothetical protein